MLIIDSRHAGTNLRFHTCDIDWRKTMNYAAAVQDDNPRYFDDERPGGVMAPPMFCVAVTWPILGNITDFIESAEFPKELLLTQVHYTEHLRFYRLLRPGDRVTIRGRIAAILPHRAGTHIVIRLDAFDASGAAVFTEHTGALLRGVTCGDEGEGRDLLPVTPRKEVPEKPVWEAAVDIDPFRPFVYDGCSDIVFPIHTSRNFARRVGLPGILLQGTATMAYAAREIVDREAAGDPERLRILAGKFTGMVSPGTRIRIQVLERRSTAVEMEVFFQVMGADNRPAISRGYALVSS
ncbi:MAG: MaoC/PaaZ C-terminal domain-containing protein [Thermodesulfobacteriota bacterium]